MDNRVMTKGFEMIEYLRQHPEILEAYWQRQKGIQTYLTDMAGERREGREEGLLEAARRFLTYGMSPDEVAEITGMTLDEVPLLGYDHRPSPRE